jgi:predicted metal-binding membrane protein
METAHSELSIGAWLDAFLAGASEHDADDIAAVIAARPRPRVATALQWALEGTGLLSAMMVTTATWLGAVILVGAGLWQFASLKRVCLRYCRSPMGFLTTHWRPGDGGAFRMGLEHGAYCLGCCWFLMALLFFGGVMNLWWIGGLAAYILAEKLFSIGDWLSYAVGIGLIAWGAILLVS